jgi:ribosome-associated heat shock protein Hsp15
MAGNACRNGKVKVNDNKVLPSYQVSIGDRVQVKKGPQVLIYKVKGIIGKRPSAKIAAEYFEDVSPPPIKMTGPMDSAFMNFPMAKRTPGAGRPTKKERRDLGKLRDID